jgi:hypothetical protein
MLPFAEICSLNFKNDISQAEVFSTLNSPVENVILFFIGETLNLLVCDDSIILQG